jgi:YVTN family beta-propeller protein
MAIHKKLLACLNSTIFRALLLGLLTAVFTFTGLHAQTRAYVANELSATVSVIDPATNTVVTTIPVGGSPDGIVASPDGSRVYVSNFNDGTVSVIDTAANSVVSTIHVGGAPAHLTISPDGTTVYVPNEFGNNVTLVDTNTNSVVGSITVGFGPFSVSVTPDGTRAYTGNFFEGTISVIDTATNTVVTTIFATTFPTLMHVTPDGAQLDVTDEFLNSVTVIDTATNAVVTTIPIGGEEVFGLAPTKDNKSVYVGVFGSNTVAIIDRATNGVVPPLITVGSNPLGMEFTPNGAFLYVANFGDSTVSEIATASNTVVATISVGGGPIGLDTTDLTVPFAQFSIEQLIINQQGFHEEGTFTLGALSNGIDPIHKPVKLTIGSFSLSIPPLSFRQVGGNDHFVFQGTVHGVQVEFNLEANRYVVNVHGPDLTGQPNPVEASLTIGNNTGSTTVTTK